MRSAAVGKERSEHAATQGQLTALKAQLAGHQAEAKAHREAFERFELESHSKVKAALELRQGALVDAQTAQEKLAQVEAAKSRQEAGHAAHLRALHATVFRDAVAMHETTLSDTLAAHEQPCA